MDKERIDGFRSAFAPGETLFWQVPAAARERMAFYSENLPRLFSEKITAVFAVSDHYALEFMRFLQGQGIRIPEDVQIIGFDDTLASRESVPALTTIHQDAALRARTAIRRLEALRDGTPCDAGIVLPVELVERESQGGCHVRLYEDPLQNRHSGHLTGNAASLLFYRGSDHDWAAGRSRYCSRGTSAS